MKIKVVSSFLIDDRNMIISIIEIEKKNQRFKTVFLRNEKNEWIPCSGIVAENALYYPDNLEYGEIIKDLIIASKKEIKKFPYPAALGLTLVNQLHSAEIFDLYKKALPFSIEKLIKKIENKYKKGDISFLAIINSSAGSSRMGVINIAIQEALMTMDKKNTRKKSNIRPSIAIEEALIETIKIRNKWKKGKVEVRKETLEDIIFLLSGNRNRKIPKKEKIKIKKITACPSCYNTNVKKMNYTDNQNNNKYICKECGFVWKSTF